MESKDALVFEGTKIRRIWYDEQWFFSVVDIVGALKDSVDAKDYRYRLKKRESESSGIELSISCRQLKMPSADRKKCETDCVLMGSRKVFNAETMICLSEVYRAAK